MPNRGPCYVLSERCKREYARRASKLRTLPSLPRSSDSARPCVCASVACSISRSICERSNQLSALAGRLLWRYRERERSQIIVQCTLYNVQSSRWELYNVHRALYIVHVPVLFEIMIMHICNEIKLGLKDRCLIF